MVSFVVPLPVSQVVEEAVAVQAAVSKARSSVTVTDPTDPEMVAPGTPPPRFTAVGAVIDRAPTVTVKVTVVAGSPPDGVLDEEYASAAGLSVPAEAAPGDSAIPTTAAAVRMRNTDVNIGPPYLTRRRLPHESTTVSNLYSTLCMQGDSIRAGEVKWGGRGRGIHER